MSEAPPPRNDLTAREVWQDLVDGVFSFERGLPYTFVTLWWKPATQARRFVATRDRALLRPLRYLLLAVAVYSALVWSLVTHFVDTAKLGISAEQMAQMELVLRHSGWLVLLILPLVGVIMRLLAWGSGLRLLDALVLLAYAQAQVLLGQALLVVPAAVFGFGLLSQLFGLALAMYLVAAIAGFIPGSRWRAWPVAVVTVVLGTIANSIMVAQFLHWHARLAA